VQQVMDRLADEFMLSSGRAERIARTEVIGALNGGHLDGYREGGASSKEWLSTDDDRTRGADPKDEFNHLAADGETVDLDAEFTKTGEALQYPGDPAGSAGNIINCRCALLPVVGKTEED